MGTNESTLPQVVINHPRIPYKVIPAVPVSEGDQVCIVALTGRFFRVLHIKSGVTLTDTKTLSAAIKFATSVQRKYLSRASFRNKLDAISWEKFIRHNSGKEDTDCTQLLYSLEFYSSLSGHVDKGVTSNEIYLHPPEPII